MRFRWRVRRWAGRKTLVRKVDKSVESSGDEVSVKVGREPCLKVEGVVENWRRGFEEAGRV